MTYLQEIATLEFRDLDSGDEGVAIVRAGSGRIALALSLRHDGDIETILSPPECAAVIEALQRGMKAAEAS
jgi:hypothetical protein